MEDLGLLTDISKSQVAKWKHYSLAGKELKSIE